ncbi:MAG: SpoVA/SpoVAEb family sporulation membrane protein [Oscillospiraceae bacterium]|jgi:stage V sporulation protein AE|nr:SpoVA/SpoVAEb family sporulation membrane protein [Oscillospiraceae bacterium]
MEIVWTLAKAFLVGGALCAVGQILLDKTKLTPGRILVIFVLTGVVLGAVGIFQPLRDWAGAGASVPLLGFGNLMAEGARKAVAEEGLLGALTGPLTAASAGITAAIVCGLLASFLAKPKAKA